MEWKYATVFISSSFNDMHSERDYLIKEVFPELTEWCEKHKIRLSDVDLRWGVSEETSKNKNTIEKCLSHIDKSRPFFLCFLGQRRGWIPDFAEDISDETINTFKGIEKTYNGRSATEMEIEYALLTPLYNFLRKKECPPTRHSLFFLRDPSYIDEITDAQRLIYTNDELVDPDKIDYATQQSKEIIEEIKSRKAKEDVKDDDDETKVNIKITDYEGSWNKNLKIPELREANGKFTENEWQGRLTNFKVKSDDGEKALKDVIIEQLKEQLKIAFKENFPEGGVIEETPLEKELNQQDNFCYMNSEGYIERETDVNRLKKYIADDSENRICLVSSKAGYGKTMLLANFATYLEREYTNKFNDKKENKKHIYKRFCGASDDSSRVLSLWQSIVEEAGIPKDYEYYPENMDALKRNIPYILDEIASKKDSVIIIDAVNQMPDGLNMLKWLSAPESSNLKIIVSVKEDPDNEKYNNQLKIIKNKSAISDNPDYCFELRPFESDDDKKELINKYLENYLKELGDDDVKTICRFKGSENPLYLKILLAELRVFGSFEQLSDKIKSFGDSPKEAFKQVLHRLEDDEQYNEADNVVKILFSLLAYSRYGLSEKELVEIISKENGASGDETKINDITNSIRINLRQVRPFLARKEGRHDFFYESFKLAAEEKYGDDKLHVNGLLADYFMEKSDPNNDLSFAEKADYDEKLRHLNELPYHLNEAEKYDMLSDVLSSFAFIKNKYEMSNVYNLIADYQFNQEHKFMQSDDHPIVLIGRALELSAPVLDNHKNQLSTQLWGRMKGIEDETIERLLNEIDSNTSDKWLKSKTNALYSPKSAIIKRIKPDGKRAATAISMVDENTIIIGNEDGTLNIFDIEDNELEILSETSSKIIKFILVDDNTILVANEDGNIKEWDINNKMVTKEYSKIETQITDIYLSKTYQKIYASSHRGVYSINLETDELRREDIEAKNYNQILVPRRNEAILVCDEKGVDGWDVYEMRKAYNRHHQNNPNDDEMIEGSVDTKMDSSSDIKFMGLNKRFLTLISENGLMKFWNTLKNSGGGESIDETFVCGFNDKFRQAKTLEDENQIITLSEMGVLRVWDIPQPRDPTFGKPVIDMQTGIRSPTAIDYFTDGENRWVIVGNKNNDVSIIDLNKKVEESDDDKHGETVLSIKLHNDNMITACENGEIYTWNFADEKLLSDDFANDFRNNCISYNYSTSEVVSAGVRHEKDGRIINKIATWKVGDGEAEDYKKTDSTVVDIAQNSSDIIFIEQNKLTIGNNEISLSETATTLVNKFESDSVFVGFEDGSIVEYPDESSFEKPVESAVTKIKITDDNKLIAGYDDGSIGIFGLDGTNLNVFKAHEKAITNINIISNSKILTVSEDNTLKFWDIDECECTYTYFLDIYSTAVNVRGDKLVIGDTLGNVRFYNMVNS